MPRSEPQSFWRRIYLKTERTGVASKAGFQILLALPLTLSLSACGADELPNSQQVVAEPPDGSAVESTAAADNVGAPVEEAFLEDIGPETGPVQLPESPLRFERPEHVRGIYVNAWAAGSLVRSERLIGLADRTEINAFVIDVKDASGFLSYSSGVPLAREIGAHRDVRIRDVSGLLARLQAAGIYPIARIVVIKDPVLTRKRPGFAIQDSAGGVWSDGREAVWADLYNRDVWDYHVALAREAALLGFPEIQWDYVRFPDGPPEALERVVYPEYDGRLRAEVVGGFLAYAREHLADLGVTMTADVFGMSTTTTRDVGVGQLWEEFIDHVDVAQPMVYPSHYGDGSFNIDRPNANPYEVVKAALGYANRRSAEVDGAGATRPWLQDFSLGDPRYLAAEVRAQIQGTYDAGIQEWLLWNASSHYTEAALEPSAGYPPGMEPVIRVAGRLIPVSERR